MQVPKSKMNPRHASDTPGNHAPALFRQPSQRGQPRHCAVRPMSAPIRDAVLPTLVRTRRRTLERGWQNPRKGDGRLFHSRPGQHRDVGPVRHVSSVTIDPVRPSPPSRHHLGHCNAIPNAVGVRGDKTPRRWLLCALRPPVSCTLESSYGQRLNGGFQHHHPRSRPWTDTGHATTLHQKQDSPGRPSTL
jgi:hypothetical protein